MKREYLVLIVLVVLMGCKPKQQIVNTINSDINRIENSVDKLTPVAIPGDSSKLKALFQCDSLNRVLLVGLSELKSKNMQSSISFTNGILEYQATTKPNTVFIKSTDRYLNITTTINKTTTIRVPVEKKLTWWQRAFLFIGKLTVGCILLILIYLIIKFYSNIKDYSKNLLQFRK